MFLFVCVVLYICLNIIGLCEIIVELELIIDLRFIIEVEIIIVIIIWMISLSLLGGGVFGIIGSVILIICLDFFVLFSEFLFEVY